MAIFHIQVKSIMESQRFYIGASTISNLCEWFSKYNCVENSNIRMFADDTTITASGKSIQQIESKIITN